MGEWKNANAGNAVDPWLIVFDSLAYGGSQLNSCKTKELTAKVRE